MFNRELKLRVKKCEIDYIELHNRINTLFALVDEVVKRNNILETQLAQSEKDKKLFADMWSQVVNHPKSTKDNKDNKPAMFGG